jgi:hypothetical protein
MPDAGPAARGVYQPRRSQASPLFRSARDKTLDKLIWLLDAATIVAAGALLWAA